MKGRKLPPERALLRDNARLRRALGEVVDIAVDWELGKLPAPRAAYEMAQAAGRALSRKRAAGHPENVRPADR